MNVDLVDLPALAQIRFLNDFAANGDPGMASQAIARTTLRLDHEMEAQIPLRGVEKSVERQCAHEAGIVRCQHW